MSDKHWNRCDVCGKFIPYVDFHNGNAIHILVIPDSLISTEEYKTLCKEHNRREEDE